MERRGSRELGNVSPYFVREEKKLQIFLEFESWRNMGPRKCFIIWKVLTELKQ